MKSSNWIGWCWKDCCKIQSKQKGFKEESNEGNVDFKSPTWGNKEVVKAGDKWWLFGEVVVAVVVVVVGGGIELPAIVDWSNCLLSNKFKSSNWWCWECWSTSNWCKSNDNISRSK